MTAMLQFATLAMTTIFAAVAALAFDWLLLRTAFHLMRPATARRAAMRSDTARESMELARTCAGRR